MHAKHAGRQLCRAHNAITSKDHNTAPHKNKHAHADSKLTQKTSAHRDMRTIGNAHTHAPTHTPHAHAHTPTCVRRAEQTPPDAYEQKNSILHARAYKHTCTDVDTRTNKHTRTCPHVRTHKEKTFTQYMRTRIRHTHTGEKSQTRKYAQETRN